jgi:hypothetical protein
MRSRQRAAGPTPEVDATSSRLDRAMTSTTDTPPDNLISKLLFWPVVLGLLFVISVVTFY